MKLDQDKATRKGGLVASCKAQHDWIIAAS